MQATLDVNNIKKTFTLSKKQMKINQQKSNKKVAVNHLSFSAYPGEIYGLLGPNGAGKTTTLRCISTLILPDEGEITVLGKSIHDGKAVRKRMGFLTNELKLEGHFTPNYLFQYFSKFHDIEKSVMEERRSALFKRFGIDSFAEVKVNALSTGMKQKVSIAVSLVHDPDVVIFDEPTNGLDVLTAKTVLDYLLELKDQGKTIIVSTHIMGVAEKLCDRIGIIIEGNMVINDTLSEIKKRYNNHALEDIFFMLYEEEVAKGGIQV